MSNFVYFEPPTATTNLFGGAITALLPPGIVDASLFRQIPDNQEIFLYPNSSISIVVEILQRAEPNDLCEAVKFHFDSLAQDNSAQMSSVSEVTILESTGDNTPSPVILHGRQLVSKFNQVNADDVRILMALYRVETKGVDVMLTMNVPVTAASDSGAVGEEGFNAVKGDFESVARSLRIVDVGLFV
ncbi:hypothetical protein EW146_g5653 [Bondarzewia mesenterica]|uniref:Mog1p/PsbP-like protein n=1 Tax=Bondarzewia mesenterica TaxID=1095465 RepID=A0A4S4LRT8_9AGAM|nr:hypothetical protein EW146_g5653 [Bondarzewia mesenterica]